MSTRRVTRSMTKMNLNPKLKEEGEKKQKEMKMRREKTKKKNRKSVKIVNKMQMK